MKIKLALVCCILALASFACASAEPGDPPGCPWEYMTYAQVVQLEETREAQIVGGVKGSPYWLWQAYLGSGSLSIRLYDVTDPIFPVQLRSQTEHVELRVDLQALDLLDRAEIRTIVLLDSEGETLSVYACEDVRTVFGYFGLEEGETLCLQGEDAPVYAYSVDRVRRALGAGN